jgi:hypothetical protein
MAETPEQREARLRSAPTPLYDATMHHHEVQQHIAFSLWRIAEALEAGNAADRARHAANVQRDMQRRR